MASLADLLSRLRGPRVDPQEVRREVWALGARHRGEVLEGARRELAVGGLPARRADLLRAVLRTHVEAPRP